MASLALNSHSLLFDVESFSSSSTEGHVAPSRKNGMLHLFKRRPVTRPTTRNRLSTSSRSCRIVMRVRGQEDTVEDRFYSLSQVDNFFLLLSDKTSKPPEESVLRTTGRSNRTF
eukprot:scaffold230772_cov40-Tisochrysis_lutea.AAC.2